MRGFLYRRILLALVFSFLVASSLAADAPVPGYSYVENPHRDATGKVYMGREIAHFMGHLGAGWLERPEREKEEMPQRPSLPSDRQLPAQNSAGSFQTPMPMHTQPMHLPMPVQPAAYPSHYIGMHQYQHQHPPMAAAHMAAAWQQQ